jgi:hypothetical protein
VKIQPQWVVTAGKQTKSLFMREKKILRKILGPISENGYWRIKINQEIYRREGKIHPRTGHEGTEGGIEV